MEYRVWYIVYGIRGVRTTGIPFLKQTPRYTIYDIVILMLFHKKTQKAAKVAWMIIGVLVIISMVIFYAPIF